MHEVYPQLGQCLSEYSPAARHQVIAELNWEKRVAAEVGAEKQSRAKLPTTNATGTQQRSGSEATDSKWDDCEAQAADQFGSVPAERRERRGRRELEGQSPTLHGNHRHHLLVVDRPDLNGPPF